MRENTWTQVRPTQVKKKNQNTENCSVAAQEVTLLLHCISWNILVPKGNTERQSLVRNSEAPWNMLKCIHGNVRFLFFVVVVAVRSSMQNDEGPNFSCLLEQMTERQRPCPLNATAKHRQNSKEIRNVPNNSFRPVLAEANGDFARPDSVWRCSSCPPSKSESQQRLSPFTADFFVQIFLRGTVCVAADGFPPADS